MNRQSFEKNKSPITLEKIKKQKKTKSIRERRGRRIITGVEVDDLSYVSNEKNKTHKTQQIGVSIIIPAYKTQDFIEECLNSIENQTYFKNNNNYEILLGIDACEDTLEKVKEIQYKYKNLFVFYFKKNVGWAIIKNSLVDRAINNNIVFFDSDDIMYNDFIEETLNIIKNNNEVDLIRYKYVKLKNNKKIKSNTPALGSCFIKKEKFIKIGGYYNLPCASDREFYERVLKNNFNVYVIEKSLFIYRFHEKQLTKSDDFGMISKIRRKIHKKIKKLTSTEIERETTNVFEIINNKPKVCFIYDRDGWAYYNKSISIKKRLDKYYDIDLIKMKTEEDLNHYDVIVCFWAGYFSTLKKLHNKGILDINRVILGTSGFKNLPNEEIKYGFANNPELYNKLNNENRYYCPNGVEIDLFKNNIRNIKNRKIINIAVVGSVIREEHKGKYRIEKIVKKLNDLGYRVKNKSLFVDSRIPNTLLSKEKMINYYKKIDVFIVSSYSEGTPNPLLEAMSMGIPCICNPVGFAPLLIKNGETGYLVDSYDDIDGYVEKIRHLIDNKEIYEEISKNSTIKIREYNWDDLSINYKRMIDDFLKNKKINILSNSSIQHKNILIFGNAPGKFQDKLLTLNEDIFKYNNINIYRCLDINSFNAIIKNKKIDMDQKYVILLAYCEDEHQPKKAPTHEKNIVNIYEFVKLIPKYFSKYKIIHDINLGNIIGNKIKTNNHLSNNGILCPKIINNYSNRDLIFQNEISNSGTPVKIIKSKNDFNFKKYNTEFINSTYNYNNNNYYTSIRFVCVKGDIASIQLRFRNVNENNPSVHNKNTPLDADLINSYYYDKVYHRMDEFRKVCSKIGNILGMGFYAHDFILSSDNDKLYLIETMFKAHDRTWFSRINPISNELVIDGNEDVVFKRMGQFLIKNILNNENNY